MPVPFLQLESEEHSFADLPYLRHRH